MHPPLPGLTAAKDPEPASFLITDCEVVADCHLSPHSIGIRVLFRGRCRDRCRDRFGGHVQIDWRVRLINRCPEITTTIPKQDAGRIGWAFEQTMYAWAVTGILDEDGCLTDAGRWLLPRVALAAWTAQPDG